MSREIKFRAYVKSFEKIMNVSEIDFQNESVIANDGFLGGLFEFDDVELMQFTGLKDKNGKEVYEGDVIIGEPGFPCKVEWDIDNACFYAPANNIPLVAVSASNFKRREVIGNIYENPELLKEAVQ
ncbi:hypothetical protein AWM68_20260 [Fictibacillus phosphorivorans]|uniref:YopX protein domain-containing protein n=1 Tax=Fictibacillus phosphorivorans TaxID=1221500 RepID=A0A165NMR4_9BACL|nr:YopX family protein [Fictibacillus phosphorivorans]KZE66776.1 hypothetical protein AWM68_20260 [Fictibacillus phosphorivorans]